MDSGLVLETATLKIPSFDEFIEPLMRVLYRHQNGLKTGVAYEATADAVGLSTEERKEFLRSGRQEVYKNRISWAHDRLKRAGLSQSPAWGVWQLTEKGRRLVENSPDGLSAEEIDRLARPMKYEQINKKAPIDDEAVNSTKTPQERIDAAIEELHESVSQEVLELIHGQTPEFFERLVLDVLQAMGYGAGSGAIKHQGGGHDSGIDGVISLDPLGLEKVYIQAKRWKDNTVCRPDVQAFCGALIGQKASKGIFIATSSFSEGAKRFARENSLSLVLIDGIKLTSLMIEYGVGIQVRRTLKVVDADRDYFEE